jgi:hypothetical protein
MLLTTPPFYFYKVQSQVILQKITPNPLETSRLTPHQIRCPYCRLIVNNLLPYIPLNNEVNNPNTPAFVTDTRMQGVPVVKGGNKKRTNKRKGGKKKSSRKMKMQKGGYAYKPGDTTLAYTFGSSSGGIPNFSNALVGANTVNPSVDSQPISNKWGAHNPFLV